MFANNEKINIKNTLELNSLNSNKNAKIKIIFIKEKNTLCKWFKMFDKQIGLEGNLYETEITIDKFKDTNNSLPCEITLYKNEKEFKKFIVTIYKCENIFYMFLINFGISFEFIFLDFGEITIEGKVYLSDNNNNIHRKRITLINFHLTYFKINNIIINIEDYIQQSKNSFQLSFYSEDIIVSKSNELFDQVLNIEDFYNNSNNKIQIFYEQFNKCLENNINDFKDLKKIVNDYHYICLKFLSFNFFQSKDILRTAFKETKYLDFFYKIFINRLVYNNLNKENTINNANDIINILTKYNKFWEKIKGDKLHNYQKVFALIEYCCLNKRYDSISYINCKKIEQNSIIYKSINFYKEFISNLDEESPVFFKLLEINSKYGYHKNNKIFTFNLLNVDDIKNHLESLIPEVIYLFFSNKTTIKAFTHLYTCEIAINEFYLFNKYKKMNLTKKLYSNEEDEDNINNIAMYLSRMMIHEDGGHIKFRNISCNKTDPNSPCKCVINGKIKTMTYLANKNNDDDLIKIFPLNKNGKGDSGHLLELAFGEFNGDYTISYLDKLKNIGILLLYPEYFVKKEKIKYLGEFIYYAYLIEQYNAKLSKRPFFKKPLEKFIPIMKKYLKKMALQININNFYKKTEKEQINFLKKKYNIEDKEEKNENDGKNSDEEELPLKINKNEKELTVKKNYGNECNIMHNIQLSEDEDENALNDANLNLDTEDENINLANLKIELTKEEGCESNDEDMVI